MTNEQFERGAFWTIIVFLCLMLVWLWGCRPVKPPIITPPPPTYSVMVGVYEGPSDEDHKAVGATVTVAQQTNVTDGAGNAIFTNLPRGHYSACVTSYTGYTPSCQPFDLPGDPVVELSLDRVIPPMEAITIGRLFRPQLHFASFLYALSKSPEQRREGLREYKRLGFNGVRVFGGELGQVGQTPESARTQFPLLLQEALEEGMYVQIAALTGTATGYDAESHLRAIGVGCAGAVNCLLEIANEPYHASQSDLLHHPDQLLSLARRALAGLSIQYALGAAESDELLNGAYAYDGGGWNTAHLDRGRDKWNQIRRLKEIWDIGFTLKKAVMSGEPIGASDATIPGRRESDPNFFYAMGALCGGFDIGCVFHSDSGLNAIPLTPHQALCAQQFIAGVGIYVPGVHYDFYNTGWQGGPVRKADFVSGSERAYSFVAGNTGYVVLTGWTTDPNLEMQNGWRKAGIIDSRQGITVLSLQR